MGMALGACLNISTGQLLPRRVRHGVGRMPKYLKWASHCHAHGIVLGVGHMPKYLNSHLVVLSHSAIITVVKKYNLQNKALICFSTLKFKDLISQLNWTGPFIYYAFVDKSSAHGTRQS